MYSEFKLSGRLRGKFPIPASKSEQGQAITLIGLAILLAALFDPLMDLSLSIRGQTGVANLKKIEQFQKQGPKRLIGKYILSLKNIGEFEIKSRNIKPTREDIPKTVKVAWELGEPQNAKVLGDYGNRLLPALLGILIGALGISIIAKSRRDKNSAQNSK